MGILTRLRLSFGKKAPFVPASIILTVRTDAGELGYKLRNLPKGGMSQLTRLTIPPQTWLLPHTTSLYALHNLIAGDVLLQSITMAYPSVPECLKKK